MSLTLNTNVASLQTQQYLNVNTTNESTSLQQLSSGNRLNSAADDPADYAIAYKLGVKSASLTTSINNGNQALVHAPGGSRRYRDDRKHPYPDEADRHRGGFFQHGLGRLARPADADNPVRNRNQQHRLRHPVRRNPGTAGWKHHVARPVGAQRHAGIDSINVADTRPRAVYTLTMTRRRRRRRDHDHDRRMRNQRLPQPSTLAAANAQGGTASSQFHRLRHQPERERRDLPRWPPQPLTVTSGTSSFTYQVGSENTGYNQISVRPSPISATTRQADSTSGRKT